jgi:hypothetical protein
MNFKNHQTMRNIILLLLLFTSLASYGQSPIYNTSSTANTSSGQWTKIASVTLTSQYSNSNSTILLSGGNSSNSVASSKLFFRVKQQSAFPGAPYIQLELIQTNNGRLQEDDIVAVTTTLNASQCTVDLYLRITNTWEVIAFTPTFINNIEPTFYSNQGFVTSLPAGTQTTCQTASNYFKSGIFNSNVGIGTTNIGSYKLAVNGSIRSKEVKVEANWSDFVFEKNYDLLTLEEVEQHIKEKGHLPEIPSEAEVGENGINLGEMNAKLLQKIEELTLYLIEQNKQNQSQQAKIELLEKKISQLENK